MMLMLLFALQNNKYSLHPYPQDEGVMLYSNLTETGNFIVYYQPATGPSGVYFQTQTAGMCIPLIGQRKSK